MTQSSLDRKTRFRMALALEDKSATQWADENGIKGGHLSQVLSRLRESKRLEEKIDDYVTETFRAHKVRAA